MPSCAAPCIRSARASRTEEKVWSRSAGTSVRFSPAARLAGQAEGDARLVDALQGLRAPAPAPRRAPRVFGRTPPRWRPWSRAAFRALELRLGQRERRLALLQVAARARSSGDLVIHVLDGVLQLEAQAADLPDLAAHGRLGHDEIGLRGIHGRLLDGDLHAGTAPGRVPRARRPFSRGCYPPRARARPARSRAARRR